MKTIVLILTFSINFFIHLFSNKNFEKLFLLRILKVDGIKQNTFCKMYFFIIYFIMMAYYHGHLRSKKCNFKD